MTSPHPDVEAIARAYQELVAATVRDRSAQAALLGLRPIDVDVLRLIAEAEPVSPARLVELISMSQGGVNAVLDRLGHAELISRSREGGGRRRVRVALTAGGREVVADERRDVSRRIDGAGRSAAQPEAMLLGVRTLLAAVRDRAADLERDAAEHTRKEADADAPLRSVLRWG